jgi:outer membrane protein TolC
MRLAVLAIAWGLAVRVNAADPAPSDGSTVLSDLVAEAIRNNPQLRSARHEVSAATSRVREATAWQPPQAGVEFFQTPVSSFPNPIKGGLETDYFVQQTFPFPGKLSRAGASAEGLAGAARASYREMERAVIARVKTAYYELYLAQQRLAINAENQQLVRQFVRSTAQRYEVGTGSQPDVLKAQTELSTLLNDALVLDQEKRLAEANLNTALARPAEQTFPAISDERLDQPLFTYAQLEPLVLEARPEVQARRALVDSARADAALARRQYFPDLMVKLTYKAMAEGRDYWAAMAALDIPVAPWSFGRVGGRVAETDANISRSDADLQNARIQALLDLQAALVGVRTNRERALLFRDTVVPQAHQALQATTAAYQANRTDFLNLLDSYRVLLQRRLDSIQAVAAYLASLAELERAVGLSMEEIASKVATAPHPEVKP